MRPLRVTAHLAQPAVLRVPPVLDGLLLAGVAQVACRDLPAGIMALEEADALPLPLARVEAGGDWWWAASQATLHGAEAMSYAHRRHAGHIAELLQGVRNIDSGAGPDKSLRVPLYSRVEMTEVSWTCIGDPEAIALALTYIDGIGARRTHGWGWIRRWEVADDPGGPDLDAYATDVRLRHLPVDALKQLPRGRVRQTFVPTRPPYHQVGRAVACWQSVAR